MANAGDCYRNGIGIERNLRLAVRWYRRAVEAGEPGAMVSLGDLMMKGKGVTKDAAEARRLFQKAADLGDEEAKKRLAAKS
jgi:TPR repeat protein